MSKNTLAVVNNSNLRNYSGETTSKNHSKIQKRTKQNAVYLMCEENLIKLFSLVK